MHPPLRGASARLVSLRYLEADGSARGRRWKGWRINDYRELGKRIKMAGGRATPRLGVVVRMKERLIYRPLNDVQMRQEKRRYYV